MTNRYAPSTGDHDDSSLSVARNGITQPRRSTNAIIFLAVADIAFDVDGIAEDQVVPTRLRSTFLRKDSLTQRDEQHGAKCRAAITFDTLVRIGEPHPTLIQNTIRTICLGDPAFVPFPDRVELK